MTPSSIALSRRGQAVPASPIRRLMPFAQQAQDNGTHIYRLNIGQPDIATPREMLDAYRSFDEDVLAYGPSGGLPELKQAIARYWKRWRVGITPDEVLVCTGGSEAILFALLTTCDPGDEILVPEPFYTNYLGFASAAGVTIRPIVCSVADGFRLPDSATLQSLVRPNTRAILFSNPGNPTGVVYTREEMERLGKLCREHDLFMLADEVYREFVYDAYDYTSAMHLEGLDDRVIIIDSVSKRFSACGARIGFVVTRNQAVLDAGLRYGQARLCPPTIDQLGAIGAYASPQSYLDDVLAEYERRRDVLYDALCGIEGVLTHRPQGAFYTVARLPVSDAERFAIWLLTDFRHEGETVMMAPACGFYATEGMGRDEVRIAYVLNTEELQKAMRILQLGLSAYPG